jgi:hypothetical protein
MNGTQIVEAVSAVAAAPRESCADEGLSAFLQTRARLFGIAYRASSAEQRRFLGVMVAACRTGDLTRLERLLVADVGSKSERSGCSLSVGPRSFDRARRRRRSSARQSSAGSQWTRPRKEKSL